MHEYPLLFYFLVFVLLLFFFPELEVFVLAVVVFLSGLYSDRVFRVLKLRRIDCGYPHVFVLPLNTKNAYAFGNSILVGKKLLEEDEEILKAIIYHELGHIHFKDFTTVFLLIFVYQAVLFTKSVFLIGSYTLLFAWVYWHMEVRSDLYAKSHGANIEKALEKFNIRWRLYFLRNSQDGTLQKVGVYLVILFLLGYCFGKELSK